MAFITTNAAHANGFGDTLRAMIEASRTKYARYRLYRQTLQELSTLSLRELDDMGINPSQIEVVAREAAYVA